MNERHRRDDAARWMLLQRMFGIGTHRAHLLCERYGTAEEIFSLSAARLGEDGFFSHEERAKILSPNLAKEEAEIALAERFGAVLLTPDSPEYPESLRNIHSMPLVLYAMGDLSLLNGHYLIAMVGARDPDEYGCAASKKLAGEIASLGGVVVSGLALGTDALCHCTALEANGKTIAFVAAGLDIDYPRNNHALRVQIEKRGLVLTEYPFGEPAHGFHFPVRNRLVSGISMAVVIVQCREYSGTMITAGHALSQGRDLFAVPDRLLSMMNGTNCLLSQGAELALSGGQILLRYPAIYGYPLESSPSSVRPDDLPELPATRSKAKAKAKAATTAPSPAAPAPLATPDYLSAEQVRVFERLADGEKPVDSLCDLCELPAGTLLAVITQLELFGLVRMLPGRMVQAVRRS